MMFGEVMLYGGKQVKRCILIIFARYPDQVIWSGVIGACVGAAAVTVILLGLLVQLVRILGVHVGQ